MNGNVSVIIPVYNCVRYIKDALSSVINQTMRADEIIVIDDGSTDNLLEILKPFQNKIKYYFQPNKGPSTARNKGIKIAKNEIIAFLDSDDYWHPRKLEKQIKLITYETGFVFCNKKNIYEQEPNRIEYKNYPKKYCSNPIKYLLTDFFASPSTVIVKRSLLIKAGGFDESLLNCEDSDLWIRLAILTRFNIVEETLVTYRVRKNSLSNFLDFAQALEMFHKPLLKNKTRILSHLNMTEREFQFKLDESRNKLEEIYKKA